MWKNPEIYFEGFSQIYASRRANMVFCWSKIYELIKEDYMLRSLWTAATGMNGQQFNIDTISHNLQLDLRKLGRILKIYSIKR